MNGYRSAVMMALVCIIAVVALSVSAVAGPGLSNAEWPKSRHDVRNSACSPTTAVAIPSIDWITDISTNGVTGTDWSFGTWCGPILDASNIYALDAGKGANGDLYCYTRNGAFNWVARKADNTSVFQFAANYATYGDVTLWNDGTIDRLITTPGGTTGSNDVWFYDIATGLQTGAGVNVNPAASALMSNDAPTVGPDGTIYTFIGPKGDFSAIAGYSGGTVYAIDGVTRQIKWSWGANGTVPGGKSLGTHWGPMALTTINGKTVIFFNMAQDKSKDFVGTTDPTFAGPLAGKSLFALEDDGNTCTLLWSAQPAFSEWCPALSNDGKTLYVACEEMWQNDVNFPNTLYAYDAATGAQKWAINTRCEHFSMPAVGRDGTIYLTSGYWRPGKAGSRTDPSGKLLAVQDNGTSASIKWNMYLDYESNSYLSAPVVTSSNPPVIYFGSTSGRLFAVKDLGNNYSLLWTYPRLAAGYTQWPTPVIADDGSVWAHWNRYIIKFKTGYDGSALGINGYVKNKAGAPIKDAWVVAATTPTPMMGNASKYFVKTDANGYYSISVPAGTWYVETWIKDKLVGQTQSVVMASDTSHATLNDFILPMCGADLCVGTGATAWTNDTTATGIANAIDGNNTTAFTTKQTISGTTPVVFMVDLGSNKSIGETVIRWKQWGVNYQFQALSDDGSGIDPQVDTNWASATTVATGSGSVGGVPTAWDTYGGINEHTEVVHFQPLSARWWRVKVTSVGSATNFAINEFELRDGEPAGPENGLCGAIRDMADGEHVYLMNGKQITAMGGGVPTDCGYIEDTGRTSAIRFHMTNLAGAKVGLGDKVGIIGEVASDSVTGEKYIEAVSISRLAYPRPLDAVVMNSRAANDTTSKGLFVKMTGKVEPATGSESFILDDGGVPVKVYCGSIDLSSYPAGSNVKVRGALSTDGSKATLLVRDTADIAHADASAQVLPLPGSQHYFRDYLIIGPFAESTTNDSNNNTRWANMLANDFLGGEANVRPSIGDVVTYTDKGTGAVTTRTWQRYNGVGDQVDFNKFFNNGTTNNWSVAYGLVYVWAPTYISSADLTVGSDDSIRAYKDGVQLWTPDLIFSRGVGYTQNWGTNGNVGFDLNPGLNIFLFKVANGTGGFGLCANIIYQGSNNNTAGWGTGLAVDGLGYYLNNPDATAP